MRTHDIVIWVTCFALGTLTAELFPNVNWTARMLPLALTVWVYIGYVLTTRRKTHRHTDSTEDHP